MSERVAPVTAASSGFGQLAARTVLIRAGRIDVRLRRRFGLS